MNATQTVATPAAREVGSSTGKDLGRIVRGTFAISLLVAAFVTVSMIGGQDQNGVANAHVDIPFSERGPDWAQIAMKLGVLSLAISAALVWVTRRRFTSMAAALVAVAAIGLTATGVYGRYHQNAISPADYRALDLGASKSEIADRFGTPVADGTYRVQGKAAECLIYANSSGDVFSAHYALCFRDDRLVARYVG